MSLPSLTRLKMVNAIAPLFPLFSARLNPARVLRLPPSPQAWSSSPCLYVLPPHNSLNITPIFPAAITCLLFHSRRIFPPLTVIHLSRGFPPFIFGRYSLAFGRLFRIRPPYSLPFSLFLSSIPLSRRFGLSFFGLAGFTSPFHPFPPQVRSISMLLKLFSLFCVFFPAARLIISLWIRVLEPVQVFPLEFPLPHFPHRAIFARHHHFFSPCGRRLCVPSTQKTQPLTPVSCSPAVRPPAPPSPPQCPFSLCHSFSRLHPLLLPLFPTTDDPRPFSPFQS